MNMVIVIDLLAARNHIKGLSVMIVKCFTGSYLLMAGYRTAPVMFVLCTAFFDSGGIGALVH